MGRKRLELSHELILEAVSSTPTMAEAARKLGVSNSSFARYAKEHGLYRPNPGQKGVKRGPSRRRMTLEQIFTTKTKVKSVDVKRRLIEASLKEEECEDCGLKPFWNGKKLVLQLDHRDGDPTNNALENLAIVCPNCHSQTPTYCRGHGKNGFTLAPVAKRYTHHV